MSRPPRHIPNPLPVLPGANPSSFIIAGAGGRGMSGAVSTPTPGYVGDRLERPVGEGKGPVPLPLSTEQARAAYCTKQPPGPGGASRASALLEGAAATPRRLRRQRKEAKRLLAVRMQVQRV